ncbi:MAG: hypothetical protein ACO3GR_05855 [Candidatus Kapaibacteriota bacterium]
MNQFSKYLYVGFLLLGLFQLIVIKDYIQSGASLGIALAFDPFDQKVTWKERPVWQKLVLIVHLAVCASLIGYGIGFNGK